MMLDFDKIMMAALTRDFDVLAEAVPELIARIRDLEERLDGLLDAIDDATKDATQMVLDAFPGSKLSSSITRTP